MDGRDFSLRLKDIKAEILALKTAYKYGLGRADFPRVIISHYFETARVYTATLTLDFGQKTTQMPFIQIFMKYTWESEPGGTITFNNGVLTMVYDLQVYDLDIPYTYEAEIIATAPIESATLEVS